MKKRVVELAKLGLSGEAIASATGLSPSTVSEYLSAPDVQAEVAAAHAQAVQQATVMDSLYDELEHTLLNQLKASIPVLSDPVEISKVLTSINRANRRRAQFKFLQDEPVLEKEPKIEINIGVSGEGRGVKEVGVLGRRGVEYKKDENNQIVEVEGRSMVTMPGGTLMKQLKSRREQR